jgi:hypothetical protein
MLLRLLLLDVFLICTFCNLKCLDQNEENDLERNAKAQESEQTAGTTLSRKVFD